MRKGQHKQLIPNVNMKRILSWKSRKGSAAPLIEKNNNGDSPDRHESGSFDNPLVQNFINSQTEGRPHRDLHSEPQISVQPGLQSSLQPSLWSLDQEAVQSMAELLGVNPDCLSVSSRANPALFKHTVVLLIQESVQKHLPEPPPDLESGLQRHLQAMQRVVLQELVKLSPLLEVYGLMGKLTESYHRGIFKQMKKLLQQASSTRTCLQLLHWALSTYLSQDLFTNPELKPDLIPHLDLVLLRDWTQQAQDRLLSLVETDVSSQLNNILTYERQHQDCQSEEDYVRTYTDVIECIEAAPNEAQKFSSELSLELRQVCLTQLHTFVSSYKTHWCEILTEDKTAKFYKILKTCTELKKHVQSVQTKRDDDNLNTVKEIVALLEDTETFTLKVLLETVAAFTETRLKKYFKSNHRYNFLMTELERVFTPESWLCLEEHKTVMDKCYKLIISLYCKLLISHKLKNLIKSWSPEVASSVAEDGELIYKIITKLCPGVERWQLLGHISEMLETKDIVTIQLTAGQIQRESREKCCTDEMPQMKTLLRWMGLSRTDTRKVLLALEANSDQDQVRPKIWCMACY